MDDVFPTSGDALDTGGVRGDESEQPFEDEAAAQAPAQEPTHRWTFIRRGGCDQVRLETGDDLRNLDHLDPKLWMALSCPVRGLEFDEKTLQLIDTDGDGRIRVPEIRAAVRWACASLKNPDDLLRGDDSLPLDAINDATDEGRQLLASARQILSNLGKADAAAISAADTSNTAGIYGQTRFNGDGVVAAEAAEDAGTQQVIGEIIACLGAENDLSGQPGITAGKVEQFFAALQAYADWCRKAEDDASSILPLGERTEPAFQALAAVRDKVEDYFTRCRLAAFDARATEALNRSAEDFAALAPKDLSAAKDEIAEFPLARIEAGRPLPLDDGINPAWRQPMDAFRQAVVGPLLGQGKAELTAGEWADLNARFAPYQQWLAAKAGQAVEPLGLDRVRAILASNVRDSLAALIAEDKALEPKMKAIAAVERLVRYHRDLVRVLDNFVAFTDFYDLERQATFQAGTLYLDGRACQLCVRVDDPAKHGALAGLSKAYLAYCTCARKDAPGTMSIAAAFTAGDSEHLMAGRNGVFYDRQGNDWDATITRVVENPISLREAVLAPYKRIGRMIGDQIEKMAAARDKAVTDQAAAGIQATAQQVEGAPAAGAPAQGAPAAAPPAFDIAKFAGVFAAIGLALGAIGTALAAVVSGFLKLPPWQMPLVILGILILISGPSVVITWLKLRQRTLGPILDACGWAVNGRVKINVPFGRALTTVATLPPGAHRQFRDPFASRTRLGCWMLVIFILALILGGLGYWLHTQRGKQEKPPAETPKVEEPAPTPPPTK